MAKRRKPHVLINCVANRYAQQNERIIEFSGGDGGGLISFLALEDGRLIVDVYNYDRTVEVRCGGSKDAWKGDVV